jgi:hypothetical protein
LAYGRLGWTEERLLNCDMRVFELALKGFNELEEERVKGEWERLRMLGLWVLSPYQKKGANLTPQKVLSLPWDPEPETREQFLKRNKHLTPLWDKLDKAK